MQRVPSPVTGGPTRIVDQFDAATIIDRYRADWGLDVKSYFDGFTSLPLYRCEETGYRFFHPPSLAGEADFYDMLWREEIQHRSENLWRDDMQFALDLLRHGERVIDVGCAEGVFVERAGHIAVAEGIDANETGCRIAIERGLKVTCTTVGGHAAKHGGSYDTVVAFQVLEHVYDVRSFMQGLIDLARRGGRIIVTVPNNEPYYAGWAKYEPLNNPPHHIGLWNEASLRAMARCFGLTVSQVSLVDAAASFRAQTYRRGAYLAGVPKSPSQLSVVDWLRVLAAAPIAAVTTAISFLSGNTARYAYIAAVLETPAKRSASPSASKP